MSEKDVKLLLMDVDGVLTDGKIFFVPSVDGSVVEAKIFDAVDGAAIGFARLAGIMTGIISGRSSPAVMRRAEELRIDYCYHGLGRKKLPAFEEIIAKTNIAPADVCYIGDDIQDLPILVRVGFPVATANARAEVLSRVNDQSSRRRGSHT